MIFGLGSKVVKAINEINRNDKNPPLNKKLNSIKVITQYLGLSPDSTTMNMLVIEAAILKLSISKDKIEFLEALKKSNKNIDILIFKTKKEKIEIPESISSLSNVKIITVDKINTDNIAGEIELFLRDKTPDELDSYNNDEATKDKHLKDKFNIGQETIETDDISEIRISGDNPIISEFDIKEGEAEFYKSDDELVKNEDNFFEIPSVLKRSHLESEKPICVSTKIEETNDISSFPITENKTYSDTSSAKLDNIKSHIKKIDITCNSGNYLEKLNLDEIHNQLLRENADYAVCLDYLETLRKTLVDTVANKEIKIADKIKIYREVVTNIVSAKRNSTEILTKRVIEIINFGLDIVQEAALRQIDNLSNVIYNMSAESVYNQITQDISELIKKRAELSTKINGIIEGINNILQNIGFIVKDTIKLNTSDIPTDNNYINEMVMPYIQLNLSSFQNGVIDLLTAVEEKTLSISMVDSKLKGLSKACFELIKVDGEIISRQSELIKNLMITKSTQTVISTTTLQNALYVFNGSEKSGKTATALIFAHLLSGKTMLIDMTGKHKFSTYTSVNKFEEQLEKMQRMNLNILEADINNLNIEKTLIFLRQATVYYTNIVILLDADTCNDIISYIDTEIKEYFCVLQHNKEQIDVTRLLIQKVTPENKIIKVVSVEPILSPLELFQKLEIDLANVGYVTIPNLQEIRRSTLEGINPSHNTAIRQVFEKEFYI